MRRSSVFKTAHAIFGAAALAACASGPSIISPEEVQNAADRQWTRLVDRGTLSADPVEIAQVERVADRILRAAGESPEEWRVAVFDEDTVYNAFALPNRSIAIFTGLLDIAETDDQLAAIIGHEVAHVRLKHAQARVNREFAPRILIGVAELPGDVIDIGPVKTVGAIAGAGVAAGTVFPFSRQEELQADRVGFEYLVAAGYDPAAAAELWRVIAEAREGMAAAPEFLSTHPSDERRIRRLDAAAEDLAEDPDT